MENFRDLLKKKNALTRSIFKLEKCPFFLNRSEFRNKLIGNDISEIPLQKMRIVLAKPVEF